MDETGIRSQTESNQMSYTLNVHQFYVIACREVLYVCHAINNGKTTTVNTIEGVRLGHFSCKHGHPFINMTEGFCLAEIIEEQGLETMHRVFAVFATERTEDVTVIVSQQLVEDMHSHIAGSTCQQHVTNGLALTFAEDIEVVVSE